MDYTMHTSTKCWITIPGILLDADMNVDALYEMLRGSAQIPDITLVITSSVLWPNEVVRCTSSNFGSMTEVDSSCAFIKSNMHHQLRLKVQEITHIKALLEYTKER